MEVLGSGPISREDQPSRPQDEPRRSLGSKISFKKQDKKNNKTKTKIKAASSVKDNDKASPKGMGGNKLCY